MLAHGCGAADARLTASARSGLQVAGRAQEQTLQPNTGTPEKRAPANERPQSPDNEANAVAVVFTRFLASAYRLTPKR